MNGMEFLKKMNDMDDELLAEADKMPQKKVFDLKKIIGIAAAFVLIIGAAIAMGNAQRTL